jgi:polyisoprenoid-binding protein YceI
MTRVTFVLTLGVAAAAAQPRAIDTAKSTMTIQVYKAGILSAFGHDHEIAAPIAAGTVDIAAKKVELRVESASLKVEDPKSSDKDRADVQATMVGPEVLDAQNYKDIRFLSTSAVAGGTGAWKVSGELTLHGQTKPVTVDVHDQGGHYTGTTRLNITDFGIKSVKVAGGAVRTKDEIQISFDIQLAH